MTQPPYADLERHVPEEEPFTYDFWDEWFRRRRPSRFARWRRRLARWLGRETR